MLSRAAVVWYGFGVEKPRDPFIIRENNYWFWCSPGNMSELFEGVLYG